MTVADPDAGSGIVTATLSVGYGILKINAGTSGATVVSGSGTSTVVVSGTIAQLNALLNTDATSGFRYIADTDAPPASTNLTVSVNDNGNTGGGGAQTGTATQIITITPVNDAPVVDLNGAAAGFDTTASYTEDGTPVSPISGIVLSDVDSANLTGATVTIATGFVAGDVLRLSGGLSGTTVSGITYSYNASTGVLSLSGSATVANYQAALATLSFKTSNDAPGTARNITVVVNDGAASSAAANIALTVTPVNDAPVVDLNGAAAGVNTTGSYTEGGAAATLVSGIVLSDADSANLTGATVTIATGFAAGDVLRLSGGLSGTTASGITYSYNATIGVLKLRGSASVADYQAALATLAFKTSNDDPGTARDITVVVMDGTASSVAANIALTITPVSDAPVVDLNGAAAGVDTTASYTEDGTPVSPISGIVLSDTDSANLTGATVTIATGFVAGDVLRLSGGLSGTTASGITYSYDSGTGVLSLNGVASLADYQSALAALSFKSNSDNPGTARDITVVVNDGSANSVAAHIMVAVTPVNDAPVNIVPTSQTTTSGANIVFSTANGNALLVSDPDAGSGMMRVRLSAEHGTLTLASTAGVTVTGDGTDVVKIDGTLTAINAALEGIRYQNVAGYVGPDALTVTTNDNGNSGSGGLLSDTDSVTITVDAAVAQAALSDKLFANDQGSDISAAFVINDNGGGYGGLDNAIYPTHSGHESILGSAFLI